MSAIDRRAEHYARLRDSAQRNPQGWASDAVVAGPRAVEHSVDREVLWDASSSLRNIDLRWWRGQPEVVAAIKAARHAVLAADTGMAREIRRERAR